MGQRGHKRMNEGNKTGLKQDRFHHSEFEFDDSQREINRFTGVSEASGNTINGPWAENRGRRGDQLRQDNPFENGKLHNWNRREGWDEYYENKSSVGRGHGGSLRHNDFGALDGGQRGKGPRGYARPDSRVREDVCEVLTRDRDIDASQIDVSVEGGVVTLSGKVDDRETKRFAGRIIENLPGVKDVQNLLEFDRT